MPRLLFCLRDTCVKPIIRLRFRPFQGLTGALESGLSTTALGSVSQRMKTFSAKPAEVRHDWFVVDASGKTLGRLSTEIARRLRGKHKPEYTPHVDTGDYIVVVNAEKLRVTGSKAKNKMYYWHTGYIGNMKSASFEKMMERSPTRVLQLAVKGMLPKNSLGRAMFRKLKIYVGSEHKHAAQQPAPLDI